MPQLILGDMHSRREHVEAVLCEAGVMDVYGNRSQSVKVTSLGDAVSLGYDEPEADFLRWLDPFVDEWLVGNHEAFHLCPHPDLKFIGCDGAPWMDRKGIEHYPGTADPAAVSIVRQWAAEGRYSVASSVGPWLITHAGLRPALQKFYREHEATLDDIVDDLNRRWRSCVNTPGLSDEFITDPSEERGGILWQRFQHLRGGYLPQHIPQIVGHTASAGPALFRSDNLWCIDCMGGCVGLYTEDDGETFRLIVSLPKDSERPEDVAKQSWPPDTDRVYRLELA